MGLHIEWGARSSSLHVAGHPAAVVELLGPGEEMPGGGRVEPGNHALIIGRVDVDAHDTRAVAVIQGSRAELERFAAALVAAVTGAEVTEPASVNT